MSVFGDVFLLAGEAVADMAVRLLGGTRRERRRLMRAGRTVGLGRLQDVVLDPRVRCPHCAKMVEPDGMICPACLHDLPQGWKQNA